MRDMHLHSNFSDGNNSIEEMIDCSISLGLKTVCFTDHVWKTSDWTDKYFEEVERCKKKYKLFVDVIGGVEAKLLDWNGGLDVSEDIYSKKVRIVGAMHRIPIGNMKFISRNEIKCNKDESKKIWLKALRGIQKNNRIECLAHPFSLLKDMDINKNSAEFWSEISDVFENMSVQIEYNVKYDNSIVPEWFWEKHKNRIVPASDSHSINELSERFERLKKIGYK